MTSKGHDKPILKGLVLAGGKSKRMGFDKGAVEWHGKEQRYYVADMLKGLCDEVYISRSSTEQEIDEQYQTLTDTFTGLGPYGAILSALSEKPDNAWLVVACDLPLLDKGTLQFLVDNRDASAIATAYGNGFQDLPEPLIAIWEPKSKEVLLSFLEKGYSCPRKVLINSNTKLLQAPNVDALTNVNTPEDFEKIKKLLNANNSLMIPDLSRYSCQVALPGFGEAAQQQLQDAKVLIVGAGGLGCPAAQYLASSGIGHLGIADNDLISLTNLHRQVLFTPKESGSNKASIATQKLKQQNPGIKITAHEVRVTSANVTALISKYDMVVDCTDNFEARYLLNDACVLSEKPLIYGAIYQYEGQVAVWNVKSKNGSYSPNYRDLFPQVNAAQIPDCAEGGVIPTLAGIIGCMQANEVIKYITNTGELLAGKVLIFDASSMQSRVIKIGNVTKTNIYSLVQTVDAPTMTEGDVKKGLQDKTIELIDIRTDQERDETDIGGEHIEADELSDHLDYITNGTTKVFYCSSGKRSAEAVKMIKKRFPEAKVFSLEGGIAKW